jgi:predicted ATPase
MIAYFRADFLKARAHLKRALDAGDLESQEEVPEGIGDDIRAVAMSYLALTSSQLGEVNRARELIDAANRRAEEIGHVPSKANPLYFKSYLESLRGDPLAALRAAEDLASLAQAHAMTHFTHMAELNIAWARGRLYDPTASAEQFRQALKAHLDHGFRIGAGFYTGLLAELEAETLGAECALARIDEALGVLRQADYRFNHPYLHRIRGNILLKRDSADPTPAEDAYETAAAAAREQGARSHELLASLSLAKVYQSTTRPAEAHAVLATALEGFSPTPEMPEIAAAQELLATLAVMDEVKATRARRQRRGQLQVAYGIVLSAARGFQAQETTQAFAEARALSATEKDGPERLVAEYGLWAASYTRGDLPSAPKRVIRNDS